jgi:hypothetical protein
VLFLWFKDNFYPLRDLSFPLFVPMIPLCLILANQIFLFLRRRWPVLRIALSKSSWILVLLILLAYSNALRIRYLYPLYFSLLILYLYLFPYIKKTAVRYIGFSILLFIVLFPNNINTYIAQSKYAAKKTDQLEEVVAFLKKSGQKFWLSE